MEAKEKDRIISRLKEIIENYDNQLNRLKAKRDVLFEFLGDILCQ